MRLASTRRSFRTRRPRAIQALIEALEPRRLMTTDIGIWDDQATPAVLADADNAAIEVGVKFRSDVTGFVTGLQFYKGETNTGTHEGHLWAADGTLLATLAFTNETASGWQTATFATSVEILANTTYVASYHTEVGHYSVTENAFVAAGVDSGPLHALATGVDGGNGVYIYGASAFPTQTFNASNYWVDVVFSTSEAPVDTAPAAPAALTATAASSSEIGLAWTDNATNETGYRVERSTDNVTFAPIATLAADATAYADTGRDPATQYFYHVFAFNGVGDSDPSNTADATTLPVSATTPAAPTGLGATAVSSTEIDLAWTDNATDETGYRVERSTDNVTFNPVTTLAADATSYADTGRAATTQYFYRVIAVNDAGDSDPSNTADATTLDAGQPPSGTITYLSDLTPTASFNGAGPAEKDTSNGGSATGDGSTITIGGVVYQKGWGVHAYSELDFDLTGGNYTRFESDFGIDDETNGKGSVTFQVLLDGVIVFDSGVVTAGPAQHVSLDVTGVKELILVVNDGGNGISNDHADWANAALFSSTPVATKPAAPTGLGATATSSSGIDLIWTDNATDETGYRVERSTDNVTFTPITTLLADATSYTDTGLTPSTQYFYRVIAVNDVGDSDPSNVTDATTLDVPATTPAAPTGLGATATSASEIHLTWADNASDETGYRVERSTDNVTFTPVTTLAADATSYADTGLTAATHYFYRVVAVNGAGDSGPSNTADATTLNNTTPPPTGTPIKLTGTPIGTAGSWNNSGNTSDKALDGDTNTYFDAANPDGNFVGLTLAVPAAITSARVYPRWSFAWRLTGGKIQGSNDNASWTDLATITAQPAEGTFTTITITDPTAYKYVRFLSPNESFGNVAEVEFYTGNTQTPPTDPPPAGTPVRLTGTPIGTSGSWNNSGNTFDKALDGDAGTFFDAPTAAGNFVGLFLGSSTVLTSVRILPRGGFSWRLTGGKIQGSINESTWVDLATIATQPAEGTFTTITITDPTAYKYVRFLSPGEGFGNVAEVEFYGITGTPTPPPTDPSKLAGASIGTAGSWNNSGNTFDKALDGDTHTYFDAPTANNNSVGLSLAAATRITSARIFPRGGFSWRVTGGKIQGSNDNASWTDLATITSQPAEGAFTTLTITDPTAYKYVRYLSPDESFGNIAEVEFYGTPA